MVVKIREMGIDDLSEVFHIGESIYSSQTFPIMYRTWDEYTVTSYFNGNPELCLVAESNGKVVGFIMATVIEKSQSAWKYGYVVWLGVRKKYQSTGVASRLYNAIEEKFKDMGVRIILADIEATNHRALNFFKKKKFDRAQIYIWVKKTI
ncbi:MAG: GNAT family N-acetyltransferase [Nitrososphaeria archaeon]